LKPFLFSAGCIVAAAISVLPLTAFKTPADFDVSQRVFPSVDGALPFDVNTKRVDELMEEARRLEKEKKPKEATDRILSAQREFDILSWQAFLALNTQVTSDDDPAPGPTPADARPRWSFWVPSQDIFRPNGEKPRPWPDIVKEAQQKDTQLVKSKAAWRQEASPQDNFQAFSGPLIDQNGKWVRYEALVDHEEFDYIVHNELYSLDGQIKFSNSEKDNQVDFPINHDKTHGAIEIKLSWKEMGPNDERSRFYIQQVNVKVSGAPGPDGKPIFRPVTAGLVGMHISMHTASSPEWIWSTFEQIDNVRSNPDGRGGHSHINFNDPAKPDEPVNMLAPKNAEIKLTSGSLQYTTWYEELTKSPTQVTRVPVPTQPGLNDLDAGIAAEVAALNKQVQAMLRARGSVFQYYELIGTQWPLDKNAPAYTGGEASAPESIAHKVEGNMVPTFLVNTTMETYFQHGLQKAGPLEEDDRLTDNSLIDDTMVTGTESCVGCHYSAGIALGYKKNPDGTYKMVDGKRVPIFGDRHNFGRTGGAHFSWMLQIEASSPNLALPSDTPRDMKTGIKKNIQP
jgi:hypothetical protein